jgi:hypothetical protein
VEDEGFGPPLDDEIVVEVPPPPVVAEAVVDAEVVVA